MTGTGSSKYGYYLAGLTSTTAFDQQHRNLYRGYWRYYNFRNNQYGNADAVNRWNGQRQLWNQHRNCFRRTQSNAALLTGAVSGVATNNYGLNVGTVTGGTAGNYGMYIGAVSSIASASNYGIGVTGSTGAANSSMNYGIKVFSVASSGTTTGDYGINILQPSGATHDAALEMEHPSQLRAIGLSFLPVPIHPISPQTLVLEPVLQPPVCRLFLPRQTLFESIRSV